MLITLLTVCWVNGLFPGDSPSASSAYIYAGQIKCAANMGLRSLVDYCDQMGAPQGFPFLHGLVGTLLGSLLMSLPGVGAFQAYLLIGWLSVAVGMTGGFLLMRRLRAPWVVALLTPAVYLCSPSVMTLPGFGATWTGFVLLPFYIWVHVAVMDRLDRPGSCWPALASLWLVSFLAVFTDGYSFIMGWLLAGCLWVAWALGTVVTRNRRLLGLGCAAGAAVTAVVAYQWYVPGGSFTATSIDLFRSMGLDLATLVLPTRQFWLWDLLSIRADFTLLWGDTTNSSFNYIGVVMVALATGLLVVRRRRLGGRVIAFAVAGGIALVLALGPSLKINDERPAALGGVVTYNSYLMPADEAAIGLPAQLLYQHVPGFQDLRATYRWFVLTRFCVIVLAGLAVAELSRSGRRTTAVVLAVIAIVETAPNVPLRAGMHSDYGDQVAALRTDLVPDFQAAVRRDDRLLFLPANNDYLVDLLAPAARVRTYNAGGDKNLTLARDSWPSPVRTAVATFGKAGEADAIDAALASGVVDAVVLPRLNLHRSAGHWPATAEEQSVGDTAAGRLLADPRFVVRRTDWFWTIRPAG